MLLVGVAVFPLLPVAPLPQVDFPTIQVSANLPGASPETMASNVAQPLERQFSLIAGLSQMTSTSGIGSTQITLQFDLNRPHRRRRARRAGGDQRLDRPAASEPAEPADLSQGQPGRLADHDAHGAVEDAAADQVNDYADNILAQQISQISRRRPGQHRRRSRSPRCACRSIPTKIAALGLSLEDVRGVHRHRLGEPAQGHDRRPRPELHRLHQRPAAEGRAVERRRPRLQATARRCACATSAWPSTRRRTTRSRAWAYARRRRRPDSGIENGRGIVLVDHQAAGRQRDRDGRRDQGRAAAPAGRDPADGQRQHR